MKQLRNATFRDAQAIDELIAGLPALERDLLGWVNQADFHVALVDTEAGDDLVGFGARATHKSHPQRDLAAVWVAPRLDDAATLADSVFAALPARRKQKPFKMRVAASDAAGLAFAARHGFVERIRSATYRVPAGALAAGLGAAVPSLTDVEVSPASDATREVTDAFTLLYQDTHRWDPPAIYTRRFVRQTMLAGAQHMAVARDAASGEVLGVGAVHASDDPTVAGDVALVGPLSQSSASDGSAASTGAARADAITGALLSHLAGFYDDQAAPLWFEIDTGEGTNASLARLVIPFATGGAEDEVVILTTD